MLSLMGGYTEIILLVIFTFSSAQNENICRTPINVSEIHITALIPARSGSKGIKNKNLSIIGNETLLARTLKAVKQCNKFDSIWVSTDHETIANEAISQGAKVHWRNPKTSTDNAPTISAVEDFLVNHSECDIIAIIQCTSPFIKKEFLCEAADEILYDSIDCIFSVTKSHQLRWTEGKGGFGIPINFSPYKRPRRQDWQGELVENGMFYFVRKNLVLQKKALQNERCKFFEIPKKYSLEVDTEFDLNLAKVMAAFLDDRSDKP